MDFRNKLDKHSHAHTQKKGEMGKMGGGKKALNNLEFSFNIYIKIKTILSQNIYICLNEEVIRSYK